jgi:hypothetical protein
MGELIPLPNPNKHTATVRLDGCVYRVEVGRVKITRVRKEGVVEEFREIALQFDVAGLEFDDEASGRKMKYVYPDTPHWCAGWYVSGFDSARHMTHHARKGSYPDQIFGIRFY